MRRGVYMAFGAALSLLAVTACGGSGAAYPIRVTDDLVAQGRPVYVRECAGCHGDAIVRPSALTTPTHQADGHTWHHPDRLLVDWVLDGVPAAKLMPVFRGQLTEDEVRATVAFIKTFWPERVRDQQARVSEEYERQLAEDGG